MGIDPKETALRNLGKDFREFLLKTNMLALAVGVVIGTAAGKVVSSIVEKLIMPFVNAVTPKGLPWNTWAPGFGEVRFGVGEVLARLLDFLIVAVVVFLVTRAFLRSTPPPPPAPTKTCPACREAIHPEATRCKFCASEQPKPAPTG